ncbi:MAG: hypothetical protein U0790_04080 [Isosphaeraceae bacterium]
MLEAIVNLVGRLLCVRLLRETTRELLEGAADLEARRTPVNEAIIKSHHEAVANLLGVGPAKAPPSSMQLEAPPKEVRPLSEAAPALQPPVPATPKRRGRPRKVVLDSSSSNGEAHLHHSTS